MSDFFSYIKRLGSLVTLPLYLVIFGMISMSCSNNKGDSVDPGPDFTSNLEGIYIDSLVMDGYRWDYEWSITKISNSSVTITFKDEMGVYSNGIHTELDTATNIRIDSPEKLDFNFYLIITSYLVV